MSCCGNKRKLWNQTLAPVQTPSSHGWTSSSDLPSPDASARPPKIFEYLGNASLFVVGAVSRKQYRFNQAGDKLEVAYEDYFGLMAERELRLVSPKPRL